MEVKVINMNSGDFGRVFKVIRMNFDNIMVNYPNMSGVRSFSFNDVECISENDIDKFLINNRSFLKIKLKRGISVLFYNALYESLKLEIKEEVKDLILLRDKYKIYKSKVWEKEMLLFINNKFPLEVRASGKNFKKNGYSININKIEKEDFLEICCGEIKIIEEQINLKKCLLSSLKEARDHIEETHEM
ncbi:hypothetical protein [Clostridium beijerinckii]|uniref:Uncharacterized protein n=1 Tax=Clostridium beijerinckii TaxID=1520 RepID=A0A1S8S120_CLOBE|nr:hypothetical protein [Clostridium beijerinckii]NRY60931.1 hypothetical protein [Clostridium beijerinckii]OOM58985.1 hypothetical protein CLBCK_37040 [Clostridium beijerinckii]